MIDKGAHKFLQEIAEAVKDKIKPFFQSNPKEPQTIGPILKGGFHEVVDEIDICLGTVHVTTRMDMLRKNSKMMPFRIYGVPIVVGLKDDELMFSFKSWDKGLPIEVEQNEVKVGSVFVDRNFGENAFEVVNEEGEPLFQMIRKNAGSIQINGIFSTPDVSPKTGTQRLLWVSEQTGMLWRSSKPDNWRLKPIFKYPSWKYPGQYAN